MNSLGLLRPVPLDLPVSWMYVTAVHVSYCAMFALVAVAPALVLNSLLRWRSAAESAWARWSVLGLALLGGAGIQLLVFADGFVFDMYGFHMNAFVWNLVTTPGGIESMGATPGTQATVAAIAIAIVALQAGLLATACRSSWLHRRAAGAFRLRNVALGIALIVAAAVGERVAYGLSTMRAYSPVLGAAGTVPFYTRARFASLGRMLGVEEVRDGSIDMSMVDGSLQYPRAPIVRAPQARDLNVVWLVAESWRADMLDPEIMPETFELAKTGTWFRNHYSGGNGTRMGMFSMFYGLYGQYWFQFLEASRSPVVMDTLIDANYDIDVRTSAKFTYPEFDKTHFVRVPADRMHEGDPDLSGWENDREHVTRLIDSIETRDPAQPFMRFLFFESAHAPYHFPKESIAFRPFKRKMNYVTMDLEVDTPQIKNSYKNACHHLDSQLARVMTYLRDHDLLDSTLVLMTGDHGEEFMEQGHWGHHSTFVDEQTRTPLVMWVPGQQAGQVERLTSHLDVAPSVLAALGVTTDPAEFSLGHDLFGDAVRDHVVVSDWKRLAVVDSEMKIVAPVRDAALSSGYVTTAIDEPVEDIAAAYATHRDRMLDVLRSLARFSR